MLQLFAYFQAESLTMTCFHAVGRHEWTVLCILKFAFSVASKIRFHACCLGAFGKFDKQNTLDGICAELLVSLASQPLMGKLSSGCLDLSRGVSRDIT